MKAVPGLSIALIALPLAGCASAPATPQRQDVEFVRGCWIERDARDGRINAFLRLLPDGPDGPDGAEYAGYLQFVRGTKPGPQIRIAIARDGRRASAELDGVRIEFPADPAASRVQDEGLHSITFAGVSNGGSGAITAAGGSDKLALTVLSNIRRLAFEGERDGCD